MQHAALRSNHQSYHECGNKILHNIREKKCFHLATKQTQTNGMQPRQNYNGRRGVFVWVDEFVGWCQDSYTNKAKEIIFDVANNREKNNIMMS